jgi:crotonobetainyl-CoA:carnitine CoA-transferase CaiB-like acyl-CoA transferase
MNGRSVRRPPPGLGEHTREVLSDFGVSAERIERLLQDRIVVQNDARTEGD